MDVASAPYQISSANHVSGWDDKWGWVCPPVRRAPRRRSYYDTIRAGILGERGRLAVEFIQPLAEDATVSDVVQFASAIVEGERNQVAVLANISALLNQYLTHINWVGFYLFPEGAGEGILGPFQGRIACTRIRLGEGVVGRCAAERKMLTVPNVLDFAGHIACDQASRSEIVVPVVYASRTVAVLDVDAPDFDRFGSPEQKLLERIAQILAHSWEQLSGA